jgi:hypothetical protein
MVLQCVVLKVLLVLLVLCGKGGREWGGESAFVGTHGLLVQCCKSIALSLLLRPTCISCSCAWTGGWQDV